MLLKSTIFWQKTNIIPATELQLHMERPTTTPIVLLAFLLLWLMPLSSPAQVHSLSWEVDGGMVLLGGLTYGISIPLQDKVLPLTEDELGELDPLLLNRFDRISTWQDSDFARLGSDIGLRASILSPLLLLADEPSRQEYGTVSIMWLETLLLTNGITRLVKSTVRRERPYAYNPFTGQELRVDPETRLSFFSGHTSNAAALSFFTAQTFVNNNPGMRRKELLWASAATLPALTGFLRVKAGKHFPTDVVVGYVVGAAIGLIVPNLHK